MKKALAPLILVLLIGLLVGASTAKASPGDLDTSFAGGAYNSPVTITDVTVQPDGKVLVLGWFGSYHSSAYLIRLNPNGSLDSTFGTGGKVSFGFGDQFSSVYPGRVVVDPLSGDVYFNYRQASYFDHNTYVVGLAPTGQPLSGFGTSGKMTISGLQSGTESVLSLVSSGLTPSKLLIASESNGGGDLFTELNSTTGAPNPAFGTSGSTTIKTSGTCDRPIDAGVLDDGSIVAEIYDCADATNALIRLNPDGSRDTSYGTNPAAFTPVSNRTTTGSNFAVSSSGQAEVLSDDGASHFLVTRYDGNGSVDTGYGSSGTAAYLVSPCCSGQAYLQQARPGTLLILPNGETAVFGTAFNNWGWGGTSSNHDEQLSVGVLKADGSALDPRFAGSGQMQLSSRNYVTDAAAVGPDSKLYADANTNISQVVRLDNVPQPAENVPAFWGLPDTPGAVATGDPVNPLTGNVTSYNQDFEVQSPGLPVQLVRFYNSGASGIDGPFGDGWSFTYGASLAVDGTSGNIKVSEPDGAQETFTALGGGAFSAPAGDHDSLAATGGGYILTRRNGVAWQFDTSGELTAITDRNGNSISLSYAGGKLSSITDPAGRTYSFGYDAAGHIEEIDFPGTSVLSPRSVHYGYSGDELVSYTDADGHETAYGYDSAGRLASIITPGSTGDPGATTSFTYDGYGRATAVTATGGFEDTHYVYDPNSLQTWVTDAAGNRTLYRFDAQGRVISRTDPQGGVTSYTYDSAGNQASVTDPDGKTTSYGYDGFGNVTSTTLPKINPSDPSHPESTFTYNAFGEILTSTDPSGAETDYSYDGDGNLLSKIEPAPAVGAARPTTTWTYYPDGQPETKTDPDGNETDYGYDGDGNLTTVTDTSGHDWTYGYDGAGRRTSSTDPLLRTASYVYDGDDNVVTVKEPPANPLETAPTLAYSYDARGNLISSADELGHTTTLSYDPNNELLSVTDPTGRQWTYSYTLLGQLFTSTDPDGVQTFYDYDKIGDETYVSTLSSDWFAIEQTAFTYDADGLMTSKTDPLGHVTAYGYDGLGRLTSVTQEDGTKAPPTTSYTYNLQGALTSTTDPDGNETDYGYDALARQISKTDAANHHWIYGYDADGNLTSSTDAENQTTSYGYDPLSRLTLIDYPSGSGTPDVSYGYDAAGEETSVTDGTGTTTYGYDGRGRVTSADHPGGQDIGYLYDLASRPTEVDYPDDLSASYTYDDAGRPMTVTDQAGNETDYSYGADGRLSTVSYPGAGDQTTYGYDAFGRVDEVDNQSSSGTPISDLKYGYDLNNNVTEIADTDSGASATFGYDALDRLTSEDWDSSWPGGALDRTYSYDAAGNRTQMTDGTGAAQITSTYAYNDLNQVTGINAVSPSGTTSSSYGYDDDGQRTSKTTDAGETDYSWNAAGQLAGATGPGGLDSAYGYDASGNRVSSTTGASSANPQTTSYLFDGSNPVLQTNPDGSASFYLRDAAGAPISVAQASSASGLTNGAADYFHLDRQGSVIGVSDSSGSSPLATYNYSAFGEPISSTRSFSQPLGYLAQPADPTTGLDDFHARNYDPELGSFISQDPLPGSIAEPRSLQRYAYGFENPLMYQDASGLCSDSFSFSTLSPSNIADCAEDAGGVALSAGEDAGQAALGEASNLVSNPCIATTIDPFAAVACYYLSPSISKGGVSWGDLENALGSAGSSVAAWAADHPYLTLTAGTIAVCLASATIGCPEAALYGFGLATGVNGYQTIAGKKSFGTAAGDEGLLALAFLATSDPIGWFPGASQSFEAALKPGGVLYWESVKGLASIMLDLASGG